MSGRTLTTATDTMGGQRPRVLWIAMNPAHQSDEAVVALLGRDALSVLQPTDSSPVTSATIANCLDAVDRLNSEIKSS